MNILFPILSVVGEVLGTTVDKLNFNKNKISSNQLIFLLFSTMVAGLLACLPVLNPPLPVVSWSIGILIAAMIVISCAQNFFEFKGLSITNLSVREPINNFKPILAGFLAYMIFPSERQPKYIIAIAIGTVILYLANSNRKLKLQLNRGVLYLALGMVCSAVLSNIYNFGLESVAPTYLLLFRTAGVLIFSIFLLNLNLKKLGGTQISYGIAGGLLHLVGNLAELYSIHQLGLTLTILIAMLGPSLIYLLSAAVLKEKVLFRQVAGSAALLLIIILVVYF